MIDQQKFGPRERSVFINCPYDQEFRPLFDAIIFATICCGFIPRCTIESRTSSIPRMEKIVETIRSSKYSIHDLSRCRGEGETNFARFNMPLELGIAMGEKFGNNNKETAHDWLILVPTGHTYIRFISDLAGYDPYVHEESVETIVPPVMSWLATREDAKRWPTTPSEVLDVFPTFQAARKILSSQWGGVEPWEMILDEGLRIAKVENLILPDLE